MRTHPYWLRMLMGSVAALLCSSSPAQNTSAPRPDFLQVDYAPLWPAKFDGGITSWGNQVSAASTGDGGWLTAWFEGGIGGRARLMARLLPPAFDDPAPALAPPLSWTGNALPPRVVAASTVFDAMSLSGEDGGLLAWKDVAGLRAVWLAQGTSALPAEPAILTNGYPGGAYLMGAADGSRFWLLTNAYATPEPGRGLLLEKTISGVRVVKEFYASGGHFPFLQMTAHRGQCLVSSYYYSYSQTGNGVRTAGVRTLTVDAAGAVSAVRELELPANTYWLGAVAHGEGYYGYWSTFYPPAGDILYGRAMTLEGGWKADSTAEVVGPVATEGYTLHLTSGPQAGVLKTGSRAWLLRPGRPMTLLQNTFGGDTFALSPIRILALGIEADGRLLATRRTFDYDTTRPDLTASLSLGAGRAGNVSLAWTQRGPQVVCEVDNYGTQGGLTLSGYNGMAAAQPGAQFLTGPFSSPAQAWAGNVQCVAWRRENDRGPAGDPDDVYVQLNTAAEDGSLTAVRAPFPLAGGFGSQRAVAVAPHYVNNEQGFMTAWREEEGDTRDGTYLTEIRAARISTTGEVNPPGGRLLDISLGELSAPAVTTGGVVYRVPQSPGGTRTLIRLASYSPPYPALSWQDLSPPEHDAVNPQILSWFSSFRMVAWRDRISGRFYVHRTNGNSSPVAVSPQGQRIREPRLAPLGYNLAAAVWMDEGAFNPKRVWLATVSEHTVSEPIPVLEGWLDNDTLAVNGDGQGRIAIAVLDRSSEAAGLKVVLVAPLTTKQGGLRIAPISGGTAVSWESDALFPFAAGTVEASTDLHHWSPLSGGAPVYESPNRAMLAVPRLPGQAHRFFRLRAALTFSP